MKAVMYACIAVISVLFSINTLAYCNQSNGVIVKKMIAESKSNYRGRCPCPYNVDKNGNECRGSSAWSKKGGASPLCYPDDVTDAMIADYCQKH